MKKILYIYRGSSVVESQQVEEGTILTQRFFGESQVTSRIESREPLDVAIGDYIRWANQKWYINSQPNIMKNSTNSYVTDIIFESQYYDMVKIQYQYFTSGEFYLAGDASDFIDLLVSNMNRVSAETWTAGTVDNTDTDVKNLHFDNINCREAVQKICSTFSGEVYFKNFQINFTDKVENATGVTLQYRAGLFNISKIAESETNIQTRIYGFGSSRNLGTTYRSGKQRLEFDNGGNNYLENNTDLYGVIEKSVNFENIYPHREGTVTAAVVGADEDVFDDSAMDFDINSYLISGVTGKVHFNTGDLAGYEFEILTYDNANKRFTLIPMKSAVGIAELPSASLKPAIGDKYTIVDIIMPASYITTAETLLEATTLAYLTINSALRVKYQVIADNHWLETYGKHFNIGDKFTLVDTDLDINVSVRVTELSYPLYDSFQYRMIISNFNDPFYLQKLIDDNLNLIDDNAIDQTGDIPRSYRNWRTNEELRAIIVAPDGYINIGLLTADNIQAGKLESADGNTYFDLDNNSIVLNAGDTTIAGTVINSIEDGADVTANNTAQDIANMLDTPSGRGFFCSATHLGFYDSGTWKTFMDNSGNFYLGGISGSLQWTASTNTLAIVGNIQTSSGTGQRAVLDGANNKFSFFNSSNEEVVTIDDTLLTVWTGIQLTGLLTIVYLNGDDENYSYMTPYKWVITTDEVDSGLYIVDDSGTVFAAFGNGDVDMAGSITMDVGETVDGVDVSTIPGLINAKEDTINLTVGRCVVTVAGGGLGVSTVTSTQIGYLANSVGDVNNAGNLNAGILPLSRLNDYSGDHDVQTFDVGVYTFTFNNQGLITTAN